VAGKKDSATTPIMVTRNKIGLGIVAGLSQKLHLK